MQRRRAQCLLCCKLLPVRELDKPGGTRCRHQRHRPAQTYDVGARMTNYSRVQMWLATIFTPPMTFCSVRNPGPIYEVKVNGQPLGKAPTLEGAKHIAESFWQADEP